MEYESYSDEEVAELLNNSYIPIRASLDDRPDIACLYYKVAKELMGFGGYPITMILTYNEQPIYSYSYVPKNSNENTIGLLEIIKTSLNEWEKNKELIINNSKNIAYYLNKYYRNEGIKRVYCTNSFEDKYIGNKDNFKSIIELVINKIRNIFRQKEKENTLSMRKNISSLEKLLYKKSFLILSYLESYSINKDSFFKEQDLNYIEDLLRNYVSKYKKKVLEDINLDESIISWIGLMVAALGRAYNVLGDKNYLKLSDKLVELIYNKLVCEKDNKILDDYSYTILGLIELYEGSYNFKYIKKAIELNEIMINSFWDEKDYGFYLYSNKKIKEIRELDRPSGNAIATYNLTKLAKLTGDSSLENYAIKQIEYISDKVKEEEVKYSFCYIASSFKISMGKKLICLVKGKKDIDKVKLALRKKEDFELTTIVVTKENKKEFERIAKFLQDYPIVNNKSTYYLCENDGSKAPVNDIKEILV